MSNLTALTLPAQRPTCGPVLVSFLLHPCGARLNKYDKTLEYWVTIREHGSQEDMRAEEKNHKSREKAWISCTNK